MPRGGPAVECSKQDSLIQLVVKLHHSCCTTHHLLTGVWLLMTYLGFFTAKVLESVLRLCCIHVLNLVTIVTRTTNHLWVNHKFRVSSYKYTARNLCVYVGDERTYQCYGPLPAILVIVGQTRDLANWDINSPSLQDAPYNQTLLQKVRISVRMVRICIPVVLAN